MRTFASGSDPEDLVGAAAAAVGSSSTYTRCVSDALDAAGVPRGAAVLLVGHSQGGIVAMDLAGDPAVNGGRVRVAQVITAAAPVSSKIVAAGTGTRVFSIENVNDIVVHLDAVNPPPTRQDAERLTYRFADDEHDTGRNHDVDLYADHMADLSDSPNPLLHEVESHMRPFLTGSASTTVFTLTNRPAG
jgi:pimeloyl-ACP methyl ester carboxylesterase